MERSKFVAQFKKCSLGINELILLSHKVSDKSIEPESEKVLVIKNFETPQSKKDTENLLGIITYVSKCIPNLSYKTESI